MHLEHNNTYCMYFIHVTLLFREITLLVEDWIIKDQMDFKKASFLSLPSKKVLNFSFCKLIIQILLLRSRLSQEKKCFSEMVWYFIGVYVVVQFSNQFHFLKLVYFFWNWFYFFKLYCFCFSYNDKLHEHILNIVHCTFLILLFRHIGKDISNTFAKLEKLAICKFVDSFSLNDCMFKK